MGDKSLSGKIILWIVLAVGIQLASVADTKDLSTCTDNSRECLIAVVVGGYILNADPGVMRLSPDFRGTFEGDNRIKEETKESITKAFTLPTTMTPELKKAFEKQHIPVPTSTGKELQKYVYEKLYSTNALYIEKIIVDERKGEVVAIWGSHSKVAPFKISKSVERFKVVNGLITELEAVDISRDEAADKATPWPAEQPCVNPPGLHVCD